MTVPAETAPKSTAVVPVRRSARDREFLPAALAIVESPPSPIHMALLVAICLLFACALTWSYFGRIDIVSVAPGRIQPQGMTKTIQSVETGRVSGINVSNGSHVTRGEVLFLLDPAEAKAAEAENAANAAAFRAEALRRGAAAEGARSGTTPTIDWPDTIPAAVARREQSVLATQLDSLRAEQKNLQAQLVQKRAERERLDKTIEAQSALVATLKERVDMRSTLMSSGSGPKAAVLDAEENHQTQAANLAYQIGQRGENTAAVAVAESQLEKSTSAFIADNDEKRENAERQADDYDQKLAATRVKAAHLVVAAPVDGVVQGSTVTTLGQVVNTGEEVMRIVPDSTALEVQAYLSNKDIGFVSSGQEAVVKVESFPFTRYGTLTGTVERVAKDAIAAQDAEQADAAPARATRNVGIAGSQHMRDLVFPVTIRLKTDVIDADGRTVPLSPGMAVTAEIKTGSRRMIDYLLSPVIEVVSTTGRER